MAKVGFIVDEMFEDSEFRVPYDALRAAGHDVIVIGREANAPLKSKQGNETITTDVAVRDTAVRELDALVIPGGYSPDALRTDANMVRLTRAIVDAGKPVAAICHAGSMLIEADVVDDRTVTSWPSIMKDLLNAGAHWVDRDVVEDGTLITSRKPGDLSAFTAAILRQLAGQIPQRMASVRRLVNA